MNRIIPLVCVPFALLGATALSPSHGPCLLASVDGTERYADEDIQALYRANTDALEDLLGFLYAECCTRNKAIAPKKIIALCK